MVAHEHPGVQALRGARYGSYLEGLKGPAYRDQVFAYIDAEDTPRPLVWQLDCLRRAGFRTVEVLHNNVTFAAFGAVK
jgi:tRNA (cmo5U34)-methyltransferase